MAKSEIVVNFERKIDIEMEAIAVFRDYLIGLDSTHNDVVFIDEFTSIRFAKLPYDLMFSKCTKRDRNLYNFKLYLELLSRLNNKPNTYRMYRGIRLKSLTEELLGHYSPYYGKIELDIQLSPICRSLMQEVVDSIVISDEVKLS